MKEKYVQTIISTIIKEITKACRGLENTHKHTLERNGH